tara:strand:+ start:6882 stop:7208 length:327 start_codon:yes stop_codon:yes gene_type:complete
MRINVVIVDENDNITQTVTRLSMIHDMIDASYISGQSINNMSFTECSVGVMSKGNNRAFIVESHGRRVTMRQVMPPKTYDELDEIRNFVREFNGTQNGNLLAKTRGEK